MRFPLIILICSLVLLLSGCGDDKKCDCDKGGGSQASGNGDSTENSGDGGSGGSAALGDISDLESDIEDFEVRSVYAYRGTGDDEEKDFTITLSSQEYDADDLNDSDDCNSVEAAKLNTNVHTFKIKISAAVDGNTEEGIPAESEYEVADADSVEEGVLLLYAGVDGDAPTNWAGSFKITTAPEEVGDDIEIEIDFEQDDSKLTGTFKGPVVSCEADS